MNTITTGLRKPRIIIYGAGQFGCYIVRIAQQKNWPIVAVFNRAGEKVGQDIGRLAGLEKDIGVIVQDAELTNYDEIQADIGIVAVSNSLAQNMPAYKHLLGAGINVICHGTESYYPRGVDAALAQQIDTLAKKNNATFTGSGIWDMSRIWSGILVAGPCTEIKSFFHKSITDIQRGGSAKELASLVGLGMTQKEFEDNIVNDLAGEIIESYKTIPEQVLSALGFTITKLTSYKEPVLFDEPIYCRVLERVLEPGLCVGSRLVVDIETQQGTASSTHIELRLFRDHEVEHTIWEIDGSPSSKVTVERKDSSHATAACMFNRIPDVIAAPAGIRVISELGLLRHTALI